MTQDSNITNILPVIFGEKQDFSLHTGEKIEIEFFPTKKGCSAYFKMPDTEIDIEISEAVFSPKEKAIYLRSELYENSWIINLNKITLKLLTDFLSETEECIA